MTGFAAIARAVLGERDDLRVAIDSSLMRRLEHAQDDQWSDASAVVSHARAVLPCRCGRGRAHEHEPCSACGLIVER